MDKKYETELSKIEKLLNKIDNELATESNKTDFSVFFKNIDKTFEIYNICLEEMCGQLYVMEYSGHSKMFRKLYHHYKHQLYNIMKYQLALQKELNDKTDEERTAAAKMESLSSKLKASNDKNKKLQNQIDDQRQKIEKLLVANNQYKLAVGSGSKLDFEPEPEPTMEVRAEPDQHAERESILNALEDERLEDEVKRVIADHNFHGIEPALKDSLLKILGDIDTQRKKAQEIDELGINALKKPVSNAFSQTDGAFVAEEEYNLLVDKIDELKKLLETEQNEKLDQEKLFIEEKVGFEAKLEAVNQELEGAKANVTFVDSINSKIKKDLEAFEIKEEGYFSQFQMLQGENEKLKSELQRISQSMNDLRELNQNYKEEFDKRQDMDTDPVEALEEKEQEAQRLSEANLALIQKLNSLEEKEMNREIVLEENVKQLLDRKNIKIEELSRELTKVIKEKKDLKKENVENKAKIESLEHNVNLLFADLKAEKQNHQPVAKARSIEAADPEPAIGERSPSKAGMAAAMEKAKAKAKKHAESGTLKASQDKKAKSVKQGDKKEKKEVMKPGAASRPRLDPSQASETQEKSPRRETTTSERREFPSSSISNLPPLDPKTQNSKVKGLSSQRLAAEDLKESRVGVSGKENELGREKNERSEKSEKFAERSDKARERKEKTKTQESQNESDQSRVSGKVERIDKKDGSSQSVRTPEVPAGDSDSDEEIEVDLEEIAEDSSSRRGSNRNSESSPTPSGSDASDQRSPFERRKEASNSFNEMNVSTYLKNRANTQGSPTNNPADQTVEDSGSFKALTFHRGTQSDYASPITFIIENAHIIEAEETDLERIKEAADILADLIGFERIEDYVGEEEHDEVPAPSGLPTSAADAPRPRSRARQVAPNSNRFDKLVKKPTLRPKIGGASPDHERSQVASAANDVPRAQSKTAKAAKFKLTEKNVTKENVLGNSVMKMTDEDYTITKTRIVKTSKNEYIEVHETMSIPKQLIVKQQIIEPPVRSQARRNYRGVEISPFEREKIEKEKLYFRVYVNLKNRYKNDPEKFVKIFKLNFNVIPNFNSRLGPNYSPDAFLFNFEEFKEHFVQILYIHQACGADCIHLRRFYEKTGIYRIGQKERYSLRNYYIDRLPELLKA